MKGKWNLVAGVLLVLFASCGNNDAKTAGNAIDSTELKTIRISIDESFEPVIREQLKVFEAAYPDVRVIARYAPEVDCLRDLQKDSTRIVLVSRGLDTSETAFFESKIGFKPSFEQLAKDAVAIIVNKNDPDSVFSLADVKKLITGNGTARIVAIDGNTATSTVRYLKDSLLDGAAFGSNVTGAKNSEDLVKYIANTPGAVGFVGVSWFTNPMSGEQEALTNKLRLGLVECKNCDKDFFAKPSQQTITFGQYPLVRGLYYVLKENYAGYGSRLINFLSTERGQLIFRRASLVPVKMSFNRRRTQLKEIN